MARLLDFIQSMEQDILTDRRKALWRPFMTAVRQYRLIDPGDRIAVCVSGGKDSLLLSVMMRMLQRHYEIPFEMKVLIMDPGYLPEHLALVEETAGSLGLDYTLIPSDVFEAAAVRPRQPCFMCARMRRGCLYKHAQALGLNKLALGHHFDDVIETALMAMLYGGQMQGMRPMLRAQNYPDLRVIRPLYRVRERDIVDWRDTYMIETVPCACRRSEDTGDSARQRVKQLIHQLEAENPKIAQNIFSSVHNVRLDSLMGWKQGGVTHSFSEDFPDP